MVLYLIVSDWDNVSCTSTTSSSCVSDLDDVTAEPFNPLLLSYVKKQLKQTEEVKDRIKELNETIYSS